jgi:hypothetical protein
MVAEEDDPAYTSTQNRRKRSSVFSGWHRWHGRLYSMKEFENTVLILTGLIGCTRDRHTKLVACFNIRQTGICLR